MRRTFLSVLGLALVVGCGDSSSCAEGEVECDGVCIDEIQPTLASIQTGIFDGSCALGSCHSAENRAQGLDLSSVDASRANLIDVEAEQVELLRVQPFSAADSYLNDKVLGINLGIDPATGTQSSRMPQTGPPLCDAKLDVIAEWINVGAP